MASSSQNQTSFQSIKDEYDYLVKAVLVGDTQVGKTQLCHAVCQNDYRFDPDERPTIGVEFATRCFTVENQVVKMQLWDTAGEERYRAITSAYYRGAVIAFLVCDSLTSLKSLQDRWWSECRNYWTADECYTVIVVNKCDNEGRFNSELIDQVQAFAQKLKIACWFVSCKDRPEELHELIGQGPIKEFIVASTTASTTAPATASTTAPASIIWSQFNNKKVDSPIVPKLAQQVKPDADDDEVEPLRLNNKDQTMFFIETKDSFERWALLLATDGKAYGIPLAMAFRKSPQSAISIDSLLRELGELDNLGEERDITRYKFSYTLQEEGNLTIFKICGTSRGYSLDQTLRHHRLTGDFQWPDANLALVMALDDDEMHG